MNPNNPWPAFEKVQCPLCDSMNTRHVFEMLEHTYKGTAARLPFVQVRCDACKGTVVGEAEARYNKEQVVNYRAKIDAKSS